MPTISREHPILGSVLEPRRKAVIGRIYTRTVVLWAHGIRIDPVQLWKNVAVRDRCDGPVITKEEDLKVDAGANNALPRWPH